METFNQPNYVVSLCGTSILTNGADNDLRKILNRYANIRDENDIPEESRKLLEKRFMEVAELLKSLDQKNAHTVSAELNSVTRFYKNQFADGRRDEHLLLCTDTWLGERAALLVSDWLKGRGLNVTVYKQTDLQTGSLEQFQLSLSELVKFLSKQSQEYRNHRYRIIFNLTGGFKSIQGFMQTLAMLYADEALYVFESGSELLRIPRLPIQLDAKEELLKHLPQFRRMRYHLPVNERELIGISEVFLFKMDGKSVLSAWGEVVWDKHIREIYGEKIWPAISSKLEYGPRFLNSVQSLTERRLFEINRKIDFLCRYLEKGGEFNLDSLDFKPLKGNPVPGSTHELDAWHDQDARRLYGHYENEVFVLDKLDKALH